MKITQKDQILQLHKEGYKIEEIIQKGFNKKYVNQVLKNIMSPPEHSSTDLQKNIRDLKYVISLLEGLCNDPQKINIKLNVSIEIATDKSITNDSAGSVTTQQSLLNPVALFRELGEDCLRKKLKDYQLTDLLKIAKTYTPDLSRKIYKEKNSDLIIDYIIERASTLSKVGQVFRSMSNPD